MDKNELVSALHQIRLIAEQVLKATGRHTRRNVPSRAERAAKSGSRKTLSIQILQAREAGFFKEARTARDVHAKLNSSYPCDLNRVAVGLLRLQERKQLRKTSKLVGKNKQVAYVW